MPEETRRSV